MVQQRRRRRATPFQPLKGPSVEAAKAGAGATLLGGASKIADSLFKKDDKRAAALDKNVEKFIRDAYHSDGSIPDKERTRPSTFVKWRDSLTLDRLTRLHEGDLGITEDALNATLERMKETAYTPPDLLERAAKDIKAKITTGKYSRYVKDKKGNYVTVNMNNLVKEKHGVDAAKLFTPAEWTELDAINKKAFGENLVRDNIGEDGTVDVEDKKRIFGIIRGMVKRGQMDNAEANEIRIATNRRMNKDLLMEIRMDNEMYKLRRRGETEMDRDLMNNDLKIWENYRNGGADLSDMDNQRPYNAYQLNSKRSVMRSMMVKERMKAVWPEKEVRLGKMEPVSLPYSVPGFTSLTDGMFDEAALRYSKENRQPFGPLGARLQRKAIGAYSNGFDLEDVGGYIQAMRFFGVDPYTAGRMLTMERLPEGITRKIMHYGGNWDNLSRLPEADRKALGTLMQTLGLGDAAKPPPPVKKPNFIMRIIQDAKEFFTKDKKRGKVEKDGTGEK